MDTLTRDAVLALHDEAIAETGGSYGFLNEHFLDAALQRPLTAFGGVELFSTVYLKAAALAHSIATTHPFVDGNKRTAYLAAAALLHHNGFCITADGAEIEKTVMDVVAGKVDLEGFAGWLRGNAVPIAEDPAAEE